MRYLVVVALAACTPPNPRLVFERQAVALAQTTEGGWSKGGAIVVGDPNTFTFPQPLSIRMKIIDDTDMEMPVELAITNAMMNPYGAGPFEIAVAPMCADTACTAELSISAQGPSMVHVSASGPDGPEADCFYYAVIDATADAAMALRDELETQQHDCRFSK